MKKTEFGSAPGRQQNALTDPDNGVPPDAKKKNGWHVVDVDSAMETLHTNKDGLSSSKAAELLKRFGFNELTERKKKTMLERIWSQINNMLVGILSVVAVVSAAKAIASRNPEDRVTDWIEVGLIVFVICLNTWIGLMQEGSAEKATEALRSMLPSNAEVIRDSTNKEVPARELVPGDIVILKTGDKVPADIRLFAVSNLACTEAALTGESLPVEKMTSPMASPEDIPLGERKNMCFSGTLVARGRGMGVVVATGDNTQIGTINALVNNVEEKKSAVLEQIDNVSMIIVASVITVGLMTFIVAFFYAELTVLDSVEIALVCAISMIPEGLASIVCLTYAFAVSNMAKLNAIVRTLPAVETLGSVTVICSDKTGTLTKNEMTLTAFITSNSRFQFNTESYDRVKDTFLTTKRGSPNLKPDPKVRNDTTAVAAHSSSYLQSAMAGGVLCSNSCLGANGGRDGEIGDPTELAILRAAYLSGVDVDGMRAKAPQIAEVPFSSEYKFMATVHEPLRDIDGPGYDNCVVHVKGAPDTLLAMCSHQAVEGSLGKQHEEPIDHDYWMHEISILSSYGLRVLALARGVVPKESVEKGEQLKPDFVKEKGQWLTMVGLYAIMDPPRPECVEAIRTAQTAGIRVVMITGDHKDTALAIADMLGLVDEKHMEALTGPELDTMDETQRRLAVMKYNVFARASPLNKIQIVEALQAEQQVCSMTGDGVNDAPALKQADMGVAMGKEGTDVAREASDMILADDNFATIVAAVREGRVVWDNLRKILFVNTSTNNAQGLCVFFGLIFGMKETLLTPIQVLYCNLICSVTLGFVLAVEPPEDGIMKHAPRKPGKRLIGRFLLLRIIIGSTALVVCTVGASYVVAGMNYDLEHIRSQASNTLTFCSMSICLSARFSYQSAFHRRILYGNPYIWYSMIPLVLVQFLITYVPGLNSMLFSMAPMDAFQWLLVISSMYFTFLIVELEKAIRASLKGHGVDTDDEEIDLLFDKK